MYFASRRLIVCLGIALISLFAVFNHSYAQMPLETRELRLQGATSGSLTLRTANTTTTYTLGYPSTMGSAGSLLFLSSTDGSLAWSGAPNGDRNIPMWDISANGGAGGIVWTDPTSASNPMWSIYGNNLAGPGTLGTTSAQGMNLVTDGKIIIALSSTGGVTINGSSQGGILTTLGRSGHTTKIDGLLDIDAATSLDGLLNINTLAGNAEATNINTSGSGLVSIGNTSNELEVNAGTLDINSPVITLDATSGISLTGPVTINTEGTGVTAIGNTMGGTSLAGPVKLSGSSGISGDVMVSQGTTSTPQWQSIGSAVGIRKAGNVSVTNAVATSVISAAGLSPTDAIIITLQGSGSTVVATVTDRDDANDTFKATFSGSYSGIVNYLVIASR